MRTSKYLGQVSKALLFTSCATSGVCPPRCRVHGLLRRQGHLMMSGVLGMTYWDMKAGKFNCVTLTKENVEKVMRDAGFMDFEWTIVDREYFHSVSDYTKSFLVLARKP
ncbi:hypothetical protein HPB49_026427 [Dermacentor silvarum]|nr:hypothetical protein HPB49_025797 [Dermacentor silvarum]KAH7987010.1 hypothetical protein HPB49_026427 [Dermacentor silvarum]